ncbi:hypothetical protein SAMN04489712_13711 [Thermomonospora echinospora]|uniref:Uncharacterized protein n=1 Tax=Thermomonospora echinospora TaxID=1992 RepID=A0A1H6E823_9ACTN|nr:hypothetical protein [Thermomonospora echinospora]SEG93096.1 hypothetical protein SAMN04489712_13711 [Thermomonospora echinospora]
MTTWIVILLCLAVAGRELYLAFDRRLPQAQAEIVYLRDQVAELSRRLDDPPPQSGAEEPEPVPEAEGPPAAGPLTRGTAPQPPRPAPAKATAAAAVSAALIRRLERELGELTARLAALEHQVGVARDAEAARAASLDALEQTVGTLYREMIDRLEREDGAVRGLLFAEEAALEPVLTLAYERCVADSGLRVRAKEPAAGSPWWTGYLLSGGDPDEVAARLVAQARSLREPGDPAPLNALLTELAGLRGTGVVRIGAFTAVRIRGTLVCGILGEDPGGADPVELAARLDGHATTVRWDPARFPLTG